MHRINAIIGPEVPFKAGQLQNCLEEWKKITSDSFVLQCITNCVLEFDYIPSPVNSVRSLHTEQKFSLVEQQAIDGEIETFLSKQIIEQSNSECGEIISPIFLTPKKDPGVYRVIFNLKFLNQAVAYHKFKMDTLESAVKLMKRDCFMSSIDLRDAYYSIPISPGYRKYLKFAWRGFLFQFRALPMGLTSSPRIFTKVLKPVFANLRTQYGHNCLGYIDDSFYTQDTEEACRETTLHAVELFTRLGFVVHPTKSIFCPAQSLEFLGFQLNSTSMTVRVTQQKIDKNLLMCRKFLKAKEFTIREIASLTGTLVSMFPGVEFGPLYYRSLEHDKDTNLKLAAGDFEKKMFLSSDSIDELKWWINALPTALRNIDHGTPELTLNTDASQIGWGATTGQNQTQGLWAQQETEYHINILEILAVKLGLVSLLNTVSNQHIRIMSDNTTTVTYINNMGGCKSKECNEVAKEIWLWAMERNNWLSAAHQPGKLNVTADSLSRHFQDGIEWQLNPGIFDKITEIFGTPEIDLFASRINHQTSVYASWKQDPYASYIDAFSINWAQFTNGYVFPPFCLVGRCLQKVMLEQATLIMIAPVWNTQAWFSRLLSLLIEHPIVFKVTRNVLCHPVHGNLHPMNSKLHLMACKVSGKSSLSAIFQKTLPMSSCAPGNQQLRNSTTFTLKNGAHFVIMGRLIQCVPVSMTC